MLGERHFFKVSISRVTCAFGPAGRQHGARVCAHQALELTSPESASACTILIATIWSVASPPAPSFMPLYTLPNDLRGVGRWQ